MLSNICSKVSEWCCFHYNDENSIVRQLPPSSVFVNHPNVNYVQLNQNIDEISNDIVDMYVQSPMFQTRGTISTLLEKKILAITTRNIVAIGVTLSLPHLIPLVRRGFECAAETGTECVHTNTNIDHSTNPSSVTEFL